MASTPEEQARQTIDDALHKAGWDVQNVQNVNVHAAKGEGIDMTYRCMIVGFFGSNGEHGIIPMTLLLKIPIQFH